MRILVVEDEKQLADGIESVLNRAGYVVDLAYEGQKGYIDILSDIYDLILLDIMLPGMNGLEILKSSSRRNQNTDYPSHCPFPG